MEHTFNRLHLVTGITSVGTFNASHDPVFGDLMGYPPRGVELVKMRLINDWNRQQPSNWKYWI
jgi:hypothetical protein